MHFKDFISICFLQVYISIASSKPADTEMAKWGRNNQINKKVWRKHSIGLEGEFIFRPNSIDVENALNNDPYLYGGSIELPAFNNYMERSKRSIEQTQESSNEVIRRNEIEQTINDDSMVKKLEVESNRVNDYPYEIAILLGKKHDGIKIGFVPKKQLYLNQERKPLNSNKSLSIVVNDTETVNTNKTSDNTVGPWRSNLEVYVKKPELTDAANKSDNLDIAKDRRNIISPRTTWLSTNYIKSVEEPDKYKVYPLQYDDAKESKISEKILLKLFSVLNKTLRKITKEHENITQTYKSMQIMHKDVDANIGQIADKLQEFEGKYSLLMDVIKQLNKFDKKMTIKEKNAQEIEKDLIKNIRHFENQQKEFLVQQRQFFTVQKIILSQNEKITDKQSQIAKTQANIAERQKMFKAELKKAEDERNKILTDGENDKYIITSEISNNIKDTSETTTESGKPVLINLMTYPSAETIKNTDEMMLKEKDKELIDDLIYKYYFNNTIIDTLMKTKVFLPSVINHRQATKKSKRTEDTTILLPVYKNNDISEKREKRWIRYKSSNNKKVSRVKTNPIRMHKGLKEYPRGKSYTKNPSLHSATTPIITTAKPDPFLKMATTFCEQIGQNANQQTLGWCVEKALRRLQYMADTKVVITDRPQKKHHATQRVAPVTNHKKHGINDRSHQMQKIFNDLGTVTPTAHTQGDDQPQEPAKSTSIEPVKMTTQQPTQVTYSTVDLQTTDLPVLNFGNTPSYFFPDNDQLETNLKEYELKADTQGNVYFDDSSLHASDIIYDTGFISEQKPSMDAMVDNDLNTIDRHVRRSVVKRYNQGPVYNTRGYRTSNK